MLIFIFVVFRHKNIRLRAARYVGRGCYFVTICCHEGLEIFTNPNLSSWFVEHLRREATTARFGVHAYCVMPNHVHFLVQGVAETSNLLAFVKSLKQKTGFEFKQTGGHSLWQKKFYDHILRSGTDLEAVAWYILMNPVRKNLVTDFRDYPFSGSFTIDWKKKTPPQKPWTPWWKNLNAGPP